MEIAEISNPGIHHGTDQIFFGTEVTYADAMGSERTITILGIDEADSAAGQGSWISPIARALLKTKMNDEAKLITPHGSQSIEIVAVRYPALPGVATAETAQVKPQVGPVAPSSPTGCV